MSEDTACLGFISFASIGVEFGVWRVELLRKVWDFGGVAFIIKN